MELFPSKTLALRGKWGEGVKIKGEGESGGPRHLAEPPFSRELCAVLGSQNLRNKTNILLI